MLGDSVFTKVIAYNVIGDSADSLTGNGAVIAFVPDAPQAMTQDYTTTLPAQIGFNWVDGESNGG